MARKRRRKRARPGVTQKVSRPAIGQRTDFSVPKAKSLLPSRTFLGKAIEKRVKRRVRAFTAKRRMERAFLGGYKRALYDPRGAVEQRVRTFIRTSGIEWGLELRNHIVCKSRSKRREVLFSLDKVGKGKGGGKDRRRTTDSKVRC